MALAMLYPEPERGRGNKDEAKKGAETASFSYRRVKEARQALDTSRQALDTPCPSLDTPCPSLDTFCRKIYARNLLNLYSAGCWTATPAVLGWDGGMEVTP